MADAITPKKSAWIFISHTDRRAKLSNSLATFFVFWLALSVLALSIDPANIRSRALSDEVRYHLPTVRHFMSGGSVSDYPSATTPGYHWLIATLTQHMDWGVTGMRIVSASFTALTAFFAARLWAQAGFAMPWLWALPLMLSMYTLPGGIWLLPDNLAWAGCFAATALSVQFGRHAQITTVRVLVIGLVIAFTVWVRQTSIWLLAMPAVIISLFAVRKQIALLRWLQFIALLTLPTSAVLGYFYMRWGGTTPPRFQTLHEGLNLVAPAWLLTYIFAANIWVLPFVFLSRTSLNLSTPSLWRWAVGTGVAGLMLSLIPETAYLPFYRAGGLWEVARACPEWLGRNPFVSFMSTFGGAFLGVLLAPMGIRGRLQVLGLLIGFTACLALNKATYDRYYYGLASVVIPLCMGEWQWRDNKAKAHPLWGAWIIGFSIFWMLIGIRSLARP